MQENKIKILAVTGIRSEYDILYSVFSAINENKNFELNIVVSGAHLAPLHNMSIKEIRNDGFKIVDEIESLINSDSLGSRVKGLGIQLQGLVQTISRIKPDLLLVLGDREEAIATALVGSYMNIPIAHICGGDRVVGNVDDQIRHAVSKLSHLHFVSNSESYDRLIKMGEQEFRVFNVGNPGLDRIRSLPSITLKQISKNLSINLVENQPLILLIQHVISTESESGEEQMLQTMIAIEEMGIQTVMSYPNSDPGSNQIIKIINQYKHLNHLHVIDNIPRLEFINIMRNASCMIGNSSAGIMEAPFLGLPVVNIGNRQKGRMHGDNIQFVSHDSIAIKESTLKAIEDLKYREQVKNAKNPYGDGRASEKIIKVLDKLTIDKDFFIKDITY